MKNIIVALDFSQVTKKMIENTITLYENMHCKVWLLHVALPHPDLKQYEEKAYTKAMREKMAEIYSHEHMQLQNCAKELRAKDVETEALMIQGNTADTIIKKAEELQANFIVIGSHGHGALHKMLLGSVSEAVLSKANCPVILIPSRHT
ncbi:MAG: universal stress protein [Nitrospinae bacterium]|nr:universal stress protein [Nitrospinota bacterium]